MTTLYFVECAGENGGHLAMDKQQEAKAKALEIYKGQGRNCRVVKAELPKMGSRELLCAAYNHEEFWKSSEVIYTAGVRKRKGGTEIEEEEEGPDVAVQIAGPVLVENPYDI
jgi:hypothetical protein